MILGFGVLQVIVVTAGRCLGSFAAAEASAQTLLQALVAADAAAQEKLRDLLMWLLR